jgi:type III pantothenate kinase
MNLVIDVGNTRAKLGVFDGSDMLFSCAVDYSDVYDQIDKLKSEFIIDAAIYSNVSGTLGGLRNYLQNEFYTLELNKNTSLPIKIAYSSPDTLGVDRRALSVAGALSSQGKACLIIDMGSCITFDFVTSENIYLGGAISPGARMRFRAMNKFTNSLPLVDLFESDNLIGNNTTHSLNNGVYFGIIAEIDAYIDKIRSKYGEIKVFITGGEHDFFVNKLKNSIFADRNFLLHGLNEILGYNFKNE